MRTATYILQAIGVVGLVVSVLAVIDLWPPDSPYFAIFGMVFAIEMTVIALAGWLRHTICKQGR